MPFLAKLKCLEKHVDFLTVLLGKQWNALFWYCWNILFKHFQNLTFQLFISKYLFEMKFFYIKILKSFKGLKSESFSFIRAKCLDWLQTKKWHFILWEISKCIVFIPFLANINSIVSFAGLFFLLRALPLFFSWFLGGCLHSSPFPVQILRSLSRVFWSHYCCCLFFKCFSKALSILL